MNQQIDLTSLTAITPIDGRYWEKVKDLSPFVSEMALIKTRVEIEARYLIALSEIGLVRSLTEKERQTFLELGANLSLAQAQRVKEIEETTRHDVKAMERAFREFVSGTSLEDITEMIHFGLTSEDVNNLAYRLMLERAARAICIPALDEVIESLCGKARQYKSLSMLARTHGQPAVPTTLGKEMANMAVRLNRQVRKLENVKLTGKLNGAVGNYNAHALAVPEADWIDFSKKFARGLGLEPNLFTTQINPYDDMIELFQAFQRVNGVLLDIDQDMWRYISDDWFTQEVKKGEVGSSTMPQKVNPIDFENSEGNAQVANSLWEGMGRKLAVSRLQRDLSDSTTIRNLGAALAYSLLACRSALAGLGKAHPNAAMMQGKLNENWAILTEGVQTVLRRVGEKDPYSLVASLSKGQHINRNEWQSWVNNLGIADDIKAKLRELTPELYKGHAEQLTEMALEEISASKKSAVPTEKTSSISKTTPIENFSRGLRQAEIPELGAPIRGKVRDNWIIEKGGSKFRLMVTTDRLSAYDNLICTIPGKGQVLNLLSAYWFEQTRDIAPNHLIAIPHPNVTFARQALATLPVEIVLRRYMAKSATSTSIYYNYAEKGRRTIYGIQFPDGLLANQEFPMGTILTPTTKAETGHDQELTDEEARETADNKLGKGTWAKVKNIAHAIFERARIHCLEKGLILVDTKYEFGIDAGGNPMLIDEIHTPDSSRFWLLETYEAKFREGTTPDTFDKEIIRRWLADNGFKGEGPVPQIDPAIIDQVAKAYTIPYKMITGKELPPSDSGPVGETAWRYVDEFLRGPSNHRPWYES